MPEPNVIVNRAGPRPGGQAEYGAATAVACTALTARSQRAQGRGAAWRLQTRRSSSWNLKVADTATWSSGKDPA